MGKNRNALSVAEREAIYQGKLNGRTISAMAKEMGCSYACARKWWRVGGRSGLAGLRAARRPRVARGVLSTFDTVVAERALYWKQHHPRRGATRILHDLSQDEQVRGRRLPHGTQLAAYFRQVCPELLQTRRRPAPRPPQARAVHELWQIDSKENIKLQDGTLATVLDVREPVACIWLGLYAHATQTDKAWRKLTLAEVQGDLRQAFSTYGLPAGLQTDREHLFGQPADEGFPSTFTLWLEGLGVQHHFSRPAQPTDQAQVERGHRTWADWIAAPQPLADLPSLQSTLDQARLVHMHDLPSRAGDCAQRPPLSVHPDVLCPHRPYQPAFEPHLFSLPRLDRFLAQFTWHYTITASSQVSIHQHVYYLGTAHARQRVDVRFDPADRHFVFSHAQTAEVLKRLPAHNLDQGSITGLTDSPPLPAHPFQLSLPFEGTLIAAHLGVQH